MKVPSWNRGKRSISHVQCTIPSILYKVCAHPDFSNYLHTSHITQYCCGYCMLEYLWVYSSTLQLPWQELTCMQYPHCTLKGTPTCCSHSITVLHETHIDGQEESICIGSAALNMCYQLNLKLAIDHSYNWHIHVKEGGLKWKRGRTKLILVPILTEHS